jgi:hypothetical protein
MVKVLPLRLHLLLRSGEQFHSFATAIAPLLATRDTPLRDVQRVFGTAIPARMEGA